MGGFLQTGEAVAPFHTNFEINIHLSYADVMVDKTKAPIHHSSRQSVKI